MAGKGKITNLIDVPKVQAEFDAIDSKIKSTIKLQETLISEALKLNAAFGNTKSIKELTQNFVLLNKVENENALNAQKIGKLTAERQIKEIQLAKAVAGTTKVTDAQTDAFKRLTQQYNEQALKAKNLGVNLGINSKEFKEAAAKANALKTQINSLNEATGNHTGSVGRYQKAIQGIGSKLMGWAAALGITIGAAKIFNIIIQSTDSLGDKFAETMAGVSSATNYFARAIVNADFTNFISGLKNAYTAGAEMEKGLDRLNEKLKAWGLQKENIELEILNLKNIARDRSKDLKERENAVNKIAELIVKQLNGEQSLANEQVAIREKNAKDLTGLSEKTIKDIVTNIDKYQNIFEESFKLNDKITEKATQKTEKGIFFNKLVYNNLWAEQTKNQQTFFRWAKANNILQAGEVSMSSNLIDAYSKQTQAKKAAAESDGSLIRIKNRLEKELIKENNAIEKQKGAYDKLTEKISTKEKILQNNLTLGVKNNDQLIIEIKNLKEQKKAIDDVFDATFKSNKEKEKKRLTTEKGTLEIEFSLMQPDSLQQLIVKQKLLENERQMELLDADKIGMKLLNADETGIAVAKINEKYDKLISDVSKDYLDKELSYISSKKQLQFEKDQQTELTALTQLLESKQITIEEYEKRKLKLENDYQIKRLQAVLDFEKANFDKIKNNTEISKATILEAEKKFVDAQKALDDAKTNNIINNQKKVEDNFKQSIDDMSSIALSFTNLMSTLNSYQYQEKYASIDELEKKDAEAKEAEMERANGNVEQEKRITAKYKAIEEQREKDRKKIAYEEAKDRKAAALFEATINLLLAASTLNIAKIVAATAAVIAIAAEPLPKYKTGLKNAEYDHWAITGDGGSEGIVYPDGSMRITPDKDTLTYLPKGASVIPNSELMKNYYTIDKTISTLPTNNNDISLLRKDINRLQYGFNMVSETIKNKQEVSFWWDNGNLRKSVQNANSRTDYINNNFKHKR